MGITYVSARDRAQVRRGFSPRGHLALTVTALVSILAITLAYAGRVRAADSAVEQTPGAASPVNLSAHPSASQLEGLMALAFDQVGDRRFAARALSGAVPIETARGALPNVGAISRMTVPLVLVESTRGLAVYAERARDARARAATTKTAAPATIPLFSAGDISALKPGFVVRTAGAHQRAVFWSAVGLLLTFQLISWFWHFRGVPGDRVLLSAAYLLTTFGAIVMIARPDPLRDTVLVVRYSQSVMLGGVICLALSVLKIRTAAFLQFHYLALAAAVLLSLVLMTFGAGPGTSGAKVNLGPFQPVELIRLLLVFFVAGYLGRRWELIRQVRETAWRSRRLPPWMDLPRAAHLMPVMGGVGLALVLFFALRDLGPALLLSLTFLAMLAVARAGIGAVVVGAVLLALGFTVGYWLEISGTLTARVAMWRAPWENAVRGGDQIAQAAWAMATGAVGGTGLGLGDTRYLPAGHTDLVLAAIGEELGLIGLLVVLAAGVVVAWRGLRIAGSAPTDTAVFLALALTLSLVVPMLVMAAGILGLIPLTGVVTPFVSYGGSAMVVNFAALGLLAAIASDGVPSSDVQPFRTPVRWLGAALATCGLVVVAGWVRVHAVSADELLVRPQLSLQADGGMRYQYNPRVLDRARSLPRGVILDRHDVPVAGDRQALDAAAKQFSAMRVALRAVCPDPEQRCYPLGGQGFHVIGNAETRSNWSASNSSYVERDAEDRLRGFDDRAVLIRHAREDGTQSTALRRDYRDLVGLVRHRWEPDHPTVLAMRNRTRDIQLTLDARLQMQVSAIVARSAMAAGVRHAAVVVLDAATGEILASVSYPWPSADGTTAAAESGALLDRARYGLYPPGSTFKLVTAAAALRQDPNLRNLAFTCSRLTADRVGVKLPGWGRPIRDDVLDHQPHGTVRMHDGMVRSCNAYFAQLAVRLGTERLAATADLAGVVFPTSGPVGRLRETLPHAGFGQGDVLASPLRMARIAAAIGTDGMIREPSLVQGLAAPAPTPFLPQDSADVIASYMRDVVTDGTGRLLRDHAIRVAGKTGTAEVDDEKSHAWFVGFAPSGTATRKIAFAVILEHAGYGGASAASVAGQVVTAAASLGLVK